MSAEPSLIYNDDDTWTLERECSIASRGYVLVVPAGFRFDLASIPRALWSLEAPFELSIAAPMVHDFLYEHGGQIVVATALTDGSATSIKVLKRFSRADADAFLLDIMRQKGVSWWRRQSAYCAVRFFGAGAWQSTALPGQIT